MVSNLWLVSLLSIFLAGCTVLSEFLGISDNKISPPPAKTQTPPTSPQKKQTQIEKCDCPPFTEPTENESSRLSVRVEKNPGKDQIQRVQALLKVSGTDPGPIDGIIGPKTRVALQRFHSKCEALTDLGARLDEIDSHETIETELPKTTTLINKTSKNPSVHEIRRLQIMLNTSGTNPGFIDGILGPRTRAALRTFYSRCMTVSHLTGTPDREVFQQAAAEIQPAPAFLSEERTEPVVSESSPPSDQSKVESKQVNNVLSQNFSLEQVRLVQARLKASGFDPGPIDGIMGPKTKAALHQELKASREY